MEKEIDYFMVSSGLTISHHSEIYNPDFIKRVSESDKRFSDIILQPIIERVGNDGWKVFISQVNPETNVWLIDIYSDNVTHFLPIKEICERYLENEIIVEHYFYKGSVINYLKK